MGREELPNTRHDYAHEISSLLLVCVSHRVPGRFAHKICKTLIVGTRIFSLCVPVP